MKILITEDQQTSIQTKLQNMVKKLGWEQASKAVGSPRNLAKLGFNDDPFEYLNTIEETFNFVKNDIKDWVLIKDNNGNTLMVYIPKIQSVFVNKYLVWSIIWNNFDLNYEGVQDVITNWFKDTYNLEVLVSRGNSAQTQFWQ